MAEFSVFRVLIVLAFGYFAFVLRPMHASPLVATSGGILLGTALVALELRAEKISLGRALGAVSGAVLGVGTGYLASLVLLHIEFGDPGTQQFTELALFLICAYTGMALGGHYGNLMSWNGAALGASSNSPERACKILDTSVIIDGRIADIADTGFLDGPLVIPQFVLRELQLVADSADSMKRNRGRRGLDVLQRIQKMPNSSVRIVEDDFPNVREVDLKLIELGKLYGGKIVTNDFNLNKVAQLRGVEVLNINELANALKPIVLPGEVMRVFILKEGKEYNQGVAYLDDGTMVVVDNAKRMISKTIDVVVTSVLQTTAGKMIFGKLDERAHPNVTEARPLRKAEAVGEA